jgi:hypothetical protein
VLRPEIWADRPRAGVDDDALEQPPAVGERDRHLGKRDEIAVTAAGLV